MGQSGPESNGNEGILHIPQIFNAGALPSDGLISYSAHSYFFGGGSYPSAEMQSVYSTVQADWASHLWVDLFKDYSYHITKLFLFRVN